MDGLSARKDKLSLMTDVIYLDVKDTSAVTLRQGSLEKLSLTKMKIQTWVVTSMVGYNILESDRLSLDLLTGARYLYLWVKPTLETQGPLGTTAVSESGSTHYWDGIVGAMGRVKLDEKWYLPFQGTWGPVIRI